MLLIDEMSECSSRVWANIDSNDPLKSNRHYVIGLKNRLLVLINSLETNYKGIKIESVETAFITFSGACTGGDFTDDNLSEEHQISFIQKSAEELKSELYKIRRSKY